MDRFAELTGRRYRLFDYAGAPEAERVIVMMGSGAETAHETVDWLVARGEKVGVLKVRLYRPFSIAERSSPRCRRRVRSIAVLDRTKEPGASASRSTRTSSPRSRGGTRAGSASRRADDRRRALRPVVARNSRPAMVKRRLRRARPSRAAERTSRSGIIDDVTHTSPAVDPDFRHRDAGRRAGASSTASARTAPSARTRTRSRSSARRRELFAQGYFVYDSKKSGAVTISHLRFGPRPIRSPYLDRGRPSFVGLPPVRASWSARRARAAPRRARRSC